MNVKKLLSIAALATALAAGVGTASASAAPTTTAPTTVNLSGSASAHTKDGKFAEDTSNYTLNATTNDLHSQLHVTTPYLFVGATGHVTIILWHDNKVFGPSQTWSVSHSLQACGIWDPTCGHDVTQSFDDHPPAYLMPAISRSTRMEVDISVS